MLTAPPGPLAGPPWLALTLLPMNWQLLNVPFSPVPEFPSQRTAPPFNALRLFSNRQSYSSGDDSAMFNAAPEFWVQMLSVNRQSSNFGEPPKT